MGIDAVQDGTFDVFFDIVIDVLVDMLIDVLIHMLTDSGTDTTSGSCGGLRFRLPTNSSGFASLLNLQLPLLFLLVTLSLLFFLLRFLTGFTLSRWSFLLTATADFRQKRIDFALHTLLAVWVATLHQKAFLFRLFVRRFDYRADHTEREEHDDDE